MRQSDSCNFGFYYREYLPMQEQNIIDKFHRRYQELRTLYWPLPEAEHIGVIIWCNN